MNEEIKEKKVGFKTKILSGIVAIVFLVGGFFGARYLLSTPPKAERTPQIKKSTLIEVTKFTPKNNRVIIEALTTIYPKSQTTIFSQILGKITYINPKLKPGIAFKEGEILLKIDESDYKIALLQKESELKKAEAALELEMGEQLVAKKEYELLGKKLKPEDEAYALRKPQLKQAIANLESAKAALAKAQNDLEKTTIKAPYNGMVVENSASLGMVVSGTSQLLRFVDTESFYADAEIELSKLPLIEKNAKAKLYPLGIKESKEATVISLIPQTDPKSKRAKLLLEIKDPLGGSNPLLVGSSAKVEIEGKEIENSTLVPLGFVRDGGSVWIYDEGVLKIKKIDVINEQQDSVLTTSIQKDEKIITTNLNGVYEGMPLEQKKGKQ